MSAAEYESAIRPDPDRHRKVLKSNTIAERKCFYAIIKRLLHRRRLLESARG